MGTGELRMLCFEREVEQCLYERNKGYWAGRGGCGVQCAVCGERDDLKLAQLHWNSRTHTRTATTAHYRSSDNLLRRGQLRAPSPPTPPIHLLHRFQYSRTCSVQSRMNPLSS